MRTDMNERKSLIIILVSFSFIMLTNGLAFAERQCTHQVIQNPDGTKTIISDCSSSYTKTQEPGAEHFRDRYFFSTIVDNLFNSVNWGIQNIQDQTAGSSSTQVMADQTAADSRQKEQEAIDAQRINQQEQEAQLKNFKH